MKGILEYDLSNKDEEMAMKRAMKSTEMANVLFEIQMNLRKKLEWDIDACNDPDFNEYGVLDMLSKKLNELFEQNNINIEELIA